MKKVMLLGLVILTAAAVSFAIDSNYSAPSDVLGAHLVYGRGCVACHAPHSGAQGNGFATTDQTTGDSGLWGADVQPYFNKTFNFGDNGSYVFTTPPDMSKGVHDAATTIMLCLSCHDGNIAINGMTKGHTVESIPNAIGGYAPTWLGNEPNGSKNDYKNDHPVGPNATIGCGGTYNWDCQIVNGKLTAPPGSHYAQFINVDYGKVIREVSFDGVNAAVACTTCHDQHSMNNWAGKIGGVQGTYKTYFFVRGYYNPGDSNSNSAAQFCRSCHGGEANEMHNTNLPTT